MCPEPRSWKWIRQRAAAERERMDQAPLEAIQEVCARRGWSLLAAHVRSNPVHTA